MASENEMIVRGMVTIRPGSKIFENESVKIPYSRSLIISDHPVLSVAFLFPAFLVKALQAAL